MDCKHKTLHFEGKHLAYLVCTCGKKWERVVDYSGNTRRTRFRAVTNKLTPEFLKAKYGITPQEANMI